LDGYIVICFRATGNRIFIKESKRARRLLEKIWKIENA